MEEDKSNEIGKELRKGPICLIVLGMAGSGKTTFVQVIDFIC
jgi:GTPase SAR1 family protein